MQNIKISTLKQLEQIPENVKAVSSLITQRDSRLCWITKNENIFIPSLEEAYNSYSFSLYRFNKRALRRPVTISTC